MAAILRRALGQRPDFDISNAAGLPQGTIQIKQRARVSRLPEGEEPKDLGLRLVRALTSVIRAEEEGERQIAVVPVSTWEDIPKAIEAELAFSEWTTAGRELQEYYAKVVSDAALGAYASGEMNLRTVLDLVDKVAQRCHGIGREITLGNTTIRALAITPAKRKRGPGHPRWVKNLAVDFVELYQRRNPDVPLTPPGGFQNPDPNKGCVLRDVTVLLAKQRLCPLNTAPLKLGEVGPMLSMKTLHEWYVQRHRVRGDLAPVGRPKKKKQ
jgi:hypothetical protein